MKSVRVSLCAVAVLVAAPSHAVAGSVRILNAAGDQNFLDIQSAVDAAHDGDVLLVAAGSYASFVLEDKSLSIIGMPGATTLVQGHEQVHDTTTSSIVVRGLKIHGDYQPLIVTNCAGHVWFDACQFTALASFNFGGEAAVTITNGAHVVFTSCQMFGGNGGDDLQLYQNGWSGGDGLLASASNVALYDCTLRGGNGGEGDQNGGGGGNGCRAYDQLVFASRCSVQGGTGGEGYYGACGSGGIGLASLLTATAYVLDDQIDGGLNGCGTANAPATSGNVSTWAGARDMQAAPVQSDQTPWIVHVQGVPGDRVSLLQATVPGFRLNGSLFGVRLVPSPLPMSIMPLGVIPASGSLDIPVAMPDVPAGMPLTRWFVQGIIGDAQGHARLATPLPLVLLNRDSGPDCNGNGVQDYVEIIEGTTPDANGNLVPDACDNTGPTWYVDAHAAPGGNGTAGAPFQTLGQAFALAQSAHTILVADGVYTGADNRNLDFAGRNLVVRSVNGPQACVIDCENAGRAFTLHSGESQAALVQGLRIINGKSPAVSLSSGGGIEVQNSSPTIENCVVTNCSAPFRGGGISLVNSNAVVRLCTLASNTTGDGLSSDGYGGGISAMGGTAQIYANWIESNTAAEWGGGVYMTSGQISHCIVRGNHAHGGGGVTVDSSGTPVRLDDALIAGNTADFGGGVFKRNASIMVIANCTLAANQADLGSSIYTNALYNPSDRLQLVNTIVWNNPTALGYRIAISEGSNLVVASSDVDGGAASVYQIPNTNSTLTWGNGNISADPAFADASGPDGDPLTVFDNDYHLTLASACIDAGDNSLVPADVFDLDGDGDVGEPVPIDLDAMARFADIPSVPDTGNGSAPIVDVGCYERQP